MFYRSVQCAKYNLGYDSWLILGFRDFTSYDLSAFYDSTNGFTTITGDTGVSTSLFNYFLLCLDDFNQSRLNDGLVTITDVDESIPLPSYAKRSNFFAIQQQERKYITILQV